ncbi:gamma-tubulin complex component 3-like [Teleopsis dalmanni]|uniref:gamma-tubulin complex component 3-like n=1 Tax=Teleopsis dalmanni TaxID=139649 RepID=UPI0018CF1F80|nr:gamma-tubulin complex component 3-like [Teleopsis dalmanni]
MGQGFISALKNELTKYYGMIAMLQEQLNQQRTSYQKNCYENVNESLTLTKLMVWAAEPLHRLKCLTIIAEKCKVQKGGELASTIYSFLGHGNPTVKALAKDLLLAVCHPLYQMLSHWMLEGVISDPHNEFFIKCINDVGPERLWKDKYSVCTDMLPTFISMDLANKILITGKSINFLREVCEDKRLMEGRDELLQCIKKDGEQIFSQVPDTKLHGIIESIFEKTSKSVLDKVKGEYKLEFHLQAHRRYLLLGQGDFICVLIELLKTELYKPAKDLRASDLTSIMDSAIRSTNAQFDGADVYNNLHICCNNPCNGEIGWDIVSIIYKIDGPLAILFEDTNQIYQVLFRPLWRMKHMEHMLSTKIWKDQKCNDKIHRPLPQ